MLLDAGRAGGEPNLHAALEYIAAGKARRQRQPRHHRPRHPIAIDLGRTLMLFGHRHTTRQPARSVLAERAGSCSRTFNPPVRHDRGTSTSAYHRCSTRTGGTPQNVRGLRSASRRCSQARGPTTHPEQAPVHQLLPGRRPGESVPDQGRHLQRITAARRSLFRTLLFKFFNRISTWELLQGHLGEITWADFSLDVYDQVLGTEFGRGGRLYSAAYIIPPPKLGGAESTPITCCCCSG